MYFLSQDNSGHWYVVPFAKRSEWAEWNDLPEDDERAWDAPDWAAPVGGSPSLVVFDEYRIE